VNFVSPSFAQSEGQSDQPAMETHEGAAAHGGGEHGGFPPFDPATWGSQILWLAITFGALYYLMSRVALPRVGAILENRSNRIAGDLAAAGRLKDETDAAIAAYEQALAEARQNAHAIAQEARDATKAEIDADRASIEADLQGKLDAAEARIAEVKAQSLSDVDSIAKDATEAMVEVLVGGEVAKSDVAKAVEAAMAGKELSR
jgi:F-type H+-transporting ATPase subunit b